MIILAHLFKRLLEALLQAHERVSRGLRGGFRTRMGIGRVATQEVLRHRGHECPRQDERADHCKDDRLCHRHEQKARDALEEKHGHERDADAQQ